MQWQHWKPHLEKSLVSLLQETNVDGQDSILKDESGEAKWERSQNRILLVQKLKAL